MPESKPPARRYKRLSKGAKASFLANLEAGLTVKEAAELTGHPAVTYHSLAARDSEFRRAKDLALEIGTDELEREARRRGVEGWEEIAIGKVAPGIDGVLRDEDGNPVVVRKYDGRLLERLLVGRRPAYANTPRVDLRNQVVNLVPPVDRSAPLLEALQVLRDCGGTVGDEPELRELMEQLPPSRPAIEQTRVVLPAPPIHGDRNTNSAWEATQAVP